MPAATGSGGPGCPQGCAASERPAGPQELLLLLLLPAARLALLARSPTRCSLLQPLSFPFVPRLG